MQLDPFHAAVLQQFTDYRRNVTYVIRNRMRLHGFKFRQVMRDGQTKAVREACRALASAGFLRAFPPRWQGEMWEFEITSEGMKAAIENRPEGTP